MVANGILLDVSVSSKTKHNKTRGSGEPVSLT